MIVPKKFSTASTLSEKIIYVISVLKNPTPDEIAMEIMELQGLSTEDAVADLRRDTKEELKRLCEGGIVSKLKVHRRKSTYILSKDIV